MPSDGARLSSRWRVLAFTPDFCSASTRPQASGRCPSQGPFSTLGGPLSLGPWTAVASACHPGCLPRLRAPTKSPCVPSTPFRKFRLSSVSSGPCVVGFERTGSPQLLQTFPLPDRNDWPDCKDSVIYSHQPWHTDL